jgi:bifunctional non-homologous end joining protein LigD
VSVGGSSCTIEVDGREVTCTNLDKVLWPALELTKGWLISYYDAVADVLLPHVTGHPVTLHRFPDGVDAPHWYQTRAPAHPPWVHTMTMAPERTGKVFDVVVVDSRAALLWAANLATIELHPYLGREPDVEHPTVAVFDLDPGAPAGMEETARVGLALRALLDGLGLQSIAKTSGNAGLHVYVPLNEPHTYAHTKMFARAVAEILRQESPGDIVTKMPRRHRVGKVFVDWSQNDAGKSTVAPYSLRGNTIPTVSAPLTWDEVAEVAARGRSSHLPVTPADVLDRLDRLGDLFHGAVTLHQQLPDGELAR